MAASKTKAKEAERVIDLDGARAARAEKRGDLESPRIRFAGEDWELPAELPADFALLIDEGRVREAIAALFPDQADAARFFANKPSIDDLEILAEGAGNLYGVDPGK